MSFNSLESLESRVLFHAGAFDPAFNGGQLLTTSFNKAGAGVSALEVLPDGSMLAAGTLNQRLNGFSTAADLVVTKYDFEGNIDTSFGANGQIIATPRGMLYANKILSTPDGEFIIQGANSGNITLAVKFTADGKVDTSFGKNGVLQIAGMGNGYTMTIDSRGGILVGGIASSDGVLRRYAPNGKLDTTFGDQGQFVIAHGAAPQPGQFHQVNIDSIITDSSGNILYSATDLLMEQDQPDDTVHTLSITESFGRLSSTGSVDSTFNATAAVSIATNNVRFGMGRVLSNGKIVLLGQTAAELNADGTINTGYGTNGVSGVIGEAFGRAAIADDGSVVMPLDTVNDKIPVAEFSLRRVRPDGKLDKTFGDNGRVILSVSSQAVPLTEVTKIAPDGTIVAASQAGQLSPSGKVDTRSFAIARLFSGDGPAVQLVPRTLRTSSRYLAVNVLIRDEDGVDTSTFDNGDLKLFDSNGATRRFLADGATDVKHDGTYIRATYHIVGPGVANWSSAANGTYDVRLQRKQIADKLGNTAAAQVLGTVRVKIT